jgi:hypothetical protein
LGAVGLIVNLLSELTWSSALLHVFIQHYPRMSYSVTRRHFFLSLTDSCPNISHIFKLVLFDLGTPD